MGGSTSRREHAPFRISDGLILIAAVAVGLAGARLWLSLQDPVNGYTLDQFVPAIAPLLMALSSAVLFVGISCERKRFRASTAEPGMAAAIVTLIGALLTTCHATAFHLLKHRSYEIIAIETVWFLASYAGSMILTLWLWMWISERWQPVTNWLGDVGRGIGAAWIVLGILSVAVRIVP